MFPRLSDEVFKSPLGGNEVGKYSFQKPHRSYGQVHSASSASALGKTVNGSPKAMLAAQP
jgi:hypothetical protein